MNATSYVKRGGPCHWDYKGYSLIAEGYPRREQFQLVDHLDSLHQEAKPRVSHIHHLDDEMGKCITLDVVWIEPEPSLDQMALWLCDWYGDVPIYIGGVAPNCRP